LTGPVFDWLDAPRFVTVLPEPTVHGRRLVAVLFHWKSKLISLHFLVFWLLALWHQCAICASLLHGKCALCHSVGRTTRHAFAYSNSYNLGKSKLSVPFIFITSTFCFRLRRHFSLILWVIRWCTLVEWQVYFSGGSVYLQAPLY
jgi:hypothetical protein